MGGKLKNRVGQIFPTKNGDIEIIEYINANNITVKFLVDNTIRTGIYMCSILSDNVAKDQKIFRVKADKIGKIYSTNNYGDIKIIKYVNAGAVDVQFLSDGTILKNIQMTAIRAGHVTNPNSEKPTLFGFGFIGVGPYKTTDESNNRLKSFWYQLWSGMVQRCYDKNSAHLHPTYDNCTIAEEWRNYQTFGKWLDDNYVSGWSLDKDILRKDNKIYSSETCCFVPTEINLCFTKSGINRGAYPIGVCFNKDSDKFQAQVKINDKSVYLGLFTSVEDAFQAYKNAKESNIKELADKYKNQLNPKVYKALYKYEVAITD